MVLVEWAREGKAKEGLLGLLAFLLMYPCDAKNGDRKSNTGHVSHVLDHLLLHAQTTFTPPLESERFALTCYNTSKDGKRYNHSEPL